MAQDKGNQEKLDVLLGRALRDKAFRDRLVANPAEVAGEAGLTEREISLIAGGLAIGAVRDPGQVMWCTEKTCNEKGGARIVMWTPNDDQPIFQSIVDVSKEPGQ